MIQKFINRVGLVVFCLCFAGCSDSTQDSNAEENAPTFAEAVTNLVNMKNKIRDGFANDDIDAAHGPLHEVGHVLSELPGLASKENLSSEKQESLKKATEQLFVAFGEVDKTLHGQEGKTYDEVAESITSAMKTIAAMAGVEDDSVTTTDLDLENDTPTSNDNNADDDQTEEVEVEDAGPPEDDDN